MPSKKIIIHAGPPKTGTSVIQLWLNNNVSSLAAHGIYYPSHDLDRNQISSGNFSEVLEVDEKKKVTFCEDKFLILMAKFEQSDAHTLLLSSEYFFKQIPTFKQYNYNYEFVVYLRPAIAFVESIYNQSVKRNGNDAPIAIRANIENPFHTMLTRYLGKYGANNFIVRGFGGHSVLGKSLVEDFAQVLNVDTTLIQTNSKYVNRSYCFDALELKRYLNRYFGTQLDSELDPLLQQYEGGEHNFSLLPQSTFDDYKKQSLAEIACIAQLVPIINKDKLTSSLNNMTRKPYRHQALGKGAAKQVLSFIANQNSRLFCEIATTLMGKLLTAQDQHVQATVKCLHDEIQSKKEDRGWLAKLKQLVKL
ncbi:hypothetical protein [Paraglaciecola sp.]|uniref:hypothetical protein n=1 Tax=Paraglaciecola sp. TaxID=1920173 RepID=UPI0032675BB3